MFGPFGLEECAMRALLCILGLHTVGQKVFAQERTILLPRMSSGASRTMPFG